MAAGTLSAPGTEYGPCEECDHIDCLVTRGMAAIPCERCGEPIGYDTGFFNATIDETLAGRGDHTQRLEHALCVYEALDA